MKAGDSVTFDYVYPGDYFSPDLAGVKAEFTVTVTGIKVVVPTQLSDDFVRSLEIEGVSDVAGSRENNRSVMQNNADAENEQILRDAVYDIIDGGSTVLKWPEKEWNYYSDLCLRDAANRAELNGIDRDSYIRQTYGSQEAYDSYVEDYCTRYVKKDLITYSLAREYGVTVDPAEYEREMLYGYERFAASYGASSLAEFEKMFSTDLTSGLLLAAALNAVAANAVVNP